MTVHLRSDEQCLRTPLAQLQALAVVVEKHPGDIVNSRIRETLQTPLHIIAMGGNLPIFREACGRHGKPCPFAPTRRARKRQDELRDDKAFADAVKQLKQVKVIPN